jgi:glucuronate isomerase
MDTGLVSLLLSRLREMPVCDPHTHVRPDQPVAAHLGDLLGYHYYTELANSSRGRPEPLPEEPGARIEYVWPHLPQLRGTMQFDWMMGISELFLDIPRADWWSRPKPEILARARKAIAAPGYARKVFEVSKIRKVFLTNQFDEDLSGLKDQRLVPCLRSDDLVFNLAANRTIQRLDKATRLKSGSDLKTFDKALSRIFDRFAAWKMSYAALGLPPSFQWQEVSPRLAERLLKRWARGGEMDAEARAAWARFMVDRLAAQCARVKAPFVLMTGADRNVYAQGIPAGQDQLRSDANLRGYDDLLNKYPQVRFPILIVTDATAVELEAAGWIRHNVYPFSHWWYNNNPVNIRRELRRRLDVLPRNKFIAFHSDGYSLEFVLPKFNTFRLQLAMVLAERIEESRAAGGQVIEPLDVDGALELAERILLRNPEEILLSRS